MKKIFLTLLSAASILIAWAQPTPIQNVGIGTATPTRAKLEVHGAVGSTTTIFGGESSGISLQRNYPAIGFNQYYTTSSKYMSIGYAANLFLDPNTGYMGLDMLGTGNANANTTALIRAFTIADNGNMGIGTNPSNATLFVKKGINVDGSAVFGGSQYNSHFHYGPNEDTYIRGGKYGSKVFINDVAGGKVVIGNGSGFVGINNGIPSYPLEIRQANGRGLLLVEPDNSFNNWELRVQGGAGGADLNLLYNGQYKGFFHYFTGNYIVYSDRRLKKGIEELKPLLQKFMQLKPGEYEMKYHNTNLKKTIGFIAQDVKQLFPELVTVTTDTSRGYPGINDLHGINYNGFTVLTIKALQEQQELIKKMQQLNKELARRIELAEARLTLKNNSSIQNRQQ
ncbi:hypothetical protein BH10BAC3_BH10BAC3_23660 [soil metagenome]